MATFYLDFENGNDSNDGTTFANRWKTITSGATAARTAPGDVIRIMKSPDPVSLAVNGTFTKQSATITLASAVTANISLCQAGWTASANVTTTTSSTRKEGTLSTSIAPAAAFTTGLLAYEATGTLNLSAYQNVTFWIRTSSAVSANVLRLDLCSDAAGATAVHSITIDTAFASNTWKPVTWKNGSALSSSIQSVALTALSDPGTPTILIDNILATNNLHFNSLIGTSSSATNQVWYPIKSINGTTVIVGASQNEDSSTTARGWHDTTTTTTAYVRDTIRLTSTQNVQEAGTASSRITYTGGWDRTNMSTQDGLTICSFDTNISSSTVINVSSFTYLTMERLIVLWGNNALYHFRSYNYFFKCGAYGNTLSSGESFGQDNYTEDLVYVSNAGSPSFFYSQAHRRYLSYSNSSIGLQIPSGSTIYLYDCTFLNNTTTGILINGLLFGQNVTCRDNQSSAIRLGGYAEINGLTCSGNGSTFASGFTGTGKINNITTSDSQLSPSVGIFSKIMLSRYSTYAGAISMDNTLLAINDVSTPVHGTSTRSFAHNTSANTSTYVPFIQPLQPFAVAASALVTFKIWVYRTSTNVEGRVRLRGYVTPGVDADVTATISAAINTWQELTVTCTPSAAGVVQIELESYSVNGSTGTVYFGDATVSQA